MGARRDPAGSARLGRTRAAGIAVACSLALVLTGACGGSSESDKEPSTPSASAALPTGLPTALPSLPTSLPGLSTGDDALKSPNIPAGFPIPPGAKVNSGTTSGNQSSVVLTGISESDLATYYRTALPAAGYKITSDNRIAGLATSMSFEGHGVTGTIAGAGVGTSNGAVITFKKQ